MDLEISPEPLPEEREAIEAALERLLADEEEDGRPAWWRAELPDASEGADESL